MRKDLFTGCFGAFLAVVLAAPMSSLAEDHNANSNGNQDQQQQSDSEAKNEEERNEAKEEAKEEKAKEDEAKSDEAQKDAEDRAEKRAEQREEMRKEREQAREAIEEHREQADEAATDAREELRDSREQQRDARSEQRDERQQSRQDLRDTRQEARESIRDERQDARSNLAEQRRSFFRGRNVRNLGLQFDEQRPDRGLSIVNLDRGGMGARLGLRRGDVIISMDGQAFQTSQDFDEALQNPETRANSLVIQRNGEQLTMQLPQWFNQGEQFSNERAFPGGTRGVLGVTFDPGYRELAVILEVQPNSAAEKIGLKAGDMLRRIDGQEVRSLPHALNLIRSMPAGEEFEIEYSRPHQETVRVALEEQENQVR